MKYDFDQIIDRKNTNSLKYDCAARRGMPEGLLPLWVADMDFRCPPEVMGALADRAAHGVFGYSEHKTDYFATLQKWLAARFGWQPQEGWLTHSPGVVFALTTAVKAFTREGDAVMIQQPVYYPFRHMVKNNDRRLVSSALVFNEQTRRYQIDFADFERQIRENDVKLFILSSPHNPVGRVWTAEELLRMGEICLRYGVIVASDEIHADFVYSGHRHTIFTQVSEKFYQNAVVCLSIGKTFNLAGLQYADILIADKTLRETFQKEYQKSGYSQLNTFGLTAAEAAYRYGAPWLDALLNYLEGNVRLIADYLPQNLPEVKLIRPEGTYLAWLDCRALGLSQTELDRRVIEKAKLWLDSGAIFGAEGEGFQRLNFACPRALLSQALENLKKIR